MWRCKLILMRYAKNPYLNSKLLRYFVQSFLSNYIKKGTIIDQTTHYEIKFKRKNTFLHLNK